MRFDEGFTLLELMVVMSIILISLMMAAPSFSGYNNTARVKDASSSIQVELQKARMEAIKRNANIGVDFIPGATNQMRTFEDVGKTGSFQSGDPVINFSTLNLNTTFDTTASSDPQGTLIGSTAKTNPPTIIFTPNGSVYTSGTTTYNGAAYVKLTDSTDASEIPQYTVTVGRYGAIQVYRYNGSVWEEK